MFHSASFCPWEYVCVFHVCRHSGGGWRRRSATEVCGWVLVVPPHVEPHAASPLPQWVLSVGPDGPQQGVCSGEMDAQARSDNYCCSLACGCFLSCVLLIILFITFFLFVLLSKGRLSLFLLLLFLYRLKTCPQVKGLDLL